MRGLLTERRRPHGPAELVADGLRVLAVASIVVAGIGWGAKGASSFAVVSLAMVGTLGSLVAGLLMPVLASAPRRVEPPVGAAEPPPRPVG